jgi:N-acetylmuramoyl-L-alanine amidase
VTVKFLTIHCAATPEGRDVKAATIDQWDVAKFGQVSYHHIVELDGATVRGLRDDQRGAHVAKNNTNNVGICYVGGCDKKMSPKDTRTPAQKQALKRLVRDYQAKYPGLIVRGHNEWPGVAKACPSFSVSAWLKAGMPV